MICGHGLGSLIVLHPALEVGDPVDTVPAGTAAAVVHSWYHESPEECLGGFLAAKGDAEHYASERAREEREIVEMPAEETAEVVKVFQDYGLSATEAATIADSLSKRPEAWVDFMMRFEVGLEEPEKGRAFRSAATIALAYIVGGLVPLSPYMLDTDPYKALLQSVGVTLVALAVFGYLKGRATETPAWRSAIQTTLIGGLAAAAAFGLAKAIS